MATSCRVSIIPSDQSNDQGGSCLPDSVPSCPPFDLPSRHQSSQPRVIGRQRQGLAKGLSRGLLLPGLELCLRQRRQDVRVLLLTEGRRLLQVRQRPQRQPFQPYPAANVPAPRVPRTQRNRLL